VFTRASPQRSVSGETGESGQLRILGWLAHSVGASYSRLCSLETDLAVGSVTKRLVDRAAAAAKGESGFAGQVVLVAVGINEFDGTFRSFDAIGTIFLDGDLYGGHCNIVLRAPDP